MAARVLRPEGKGFLFLDSHPDGCALTVDEMIAETGELAPASEAAEPWPGRSWPEQP